MIACVVVAPELARAQPARVAMVTPPSRPGREPASERAAPRVRAWPFRGAVARALTGLAGPDPAERARAARVLSHHGERAAVIDALIARLREESDSGVRVAIVRALLYRRATEATEVMVELLGRAHGDDRSALAFALAELGTRSALAALVGGAVHTPTRDACVAALGRAGSPALRPLAELATTAPTVAALLAAIGELRSPEAATVLLGYVADERADVRVAALRALAVSGDLRGAPAARRALADEAPEVRSAAIHALGRLGQPSDAEAIEAALTGEFDEDRVPLEALASLAPGRAGQRLAEHLAGEQRAAAVALAADHAAAGLVPFFAAALAHPQQVTAASDALARVSHAAALDALVDGLGRAPNDPDLARALAVWVASFGPGARRAAHRGRAALAAGPDSPRQLLLRALAGDDAVLDRAVSMLSGAEESTPDERAIAADALGALGGDAAIEALRDGLSGERDDEVFARRAHALLSLPGPSAARAPRGIGAWFDHGRRGDLALQLAARDAEGLSAATRLRLRRRARAGLRDSRPQRRHAALLALALAGEAAAAPSVAPLLEDPRPEVRAAAAIALRAFARPEQRDALRVARALERDIVVAGHLEAAFLAAQNAAPRPPVFGGRTVVRIRVSRTHAEGDFDPITLFLPDGRWQRRRPMATGEVFIPRVPVGVGAL